jgi:hypoxanthine phosphoribosyltransferase
MLGRRAEVTDPRPAGPPMLGAPMGLVDRGKRDRRFRLLRVLPVKKLLSEEELREGVARMAAQIQADFQGKPVTILGVMTGSVVLLADLIRRIDLPLRVGVIQASSYRGETTRGELRVNAELMPEVAGRDVLLVDDIFDTGHTLVELAKRLRELDVRSVQSAVLLFKEGRQEVDYRPEYVGFQIPDQFVVGYGLDYRDEYRHLPFVAALEPAEIAGPAA